MLYDGGALRDGGEVDIWKRNYIGLVVQYAAVGMVYGTLPGAVYPFLFNYLNMEGTQVVSAAVLLNMPWSFKLFFGMITDCVPIMGYRRRPFMVIGWTVCFAMLLVMACMDAGPPYYPDEKYATMEKEELTPEIIATFNESAHHVGGKFVVLMMIAAIGYVSADVAADAMMVEVAQREPEATRGYTQTTIYMVRTAFVMISSILTGMAFNGKHYGGDFDFSLSFPQLMTVLSIYCLPVIPISWYYILEDPHPGMVFREYLDELWNLVQMRPMYQVIAYKFLAGIFENFSVTLAEALPNGIAFVIATFVMVELAGEGNEGAVYGLVGSISNIAIPLASTLTKNVDSNFDVSNADIVEDSHHVRWEVTYVLIIRYTINLAGLLFLPLLPRQKAETQQLKQIVPILEEETMGTTPRKKIDLLAPAPSTTDFNYSLKDNEWFLDPKSPQLYEGGALRDGGEVNIWSRDYIGLIAQYATVGMIFGTLPGTVYPFLFNYLNMEGTQVVSATVLLNMPWSFKIFYGMITDCVPIWGYRRRPFMVIGWTITFLTLVAMSCMDAGDPYYPDNKYATMEKEELTPELIATFNEPAHHVGGKFIVMMMIAAVGYVGADVAADAMMVEVAQREPEATRGYCQTTIYMVRTAFVTISSILTGLAFNGKHYGGDFDFSLSFPQLMLILSVCCFPVIPLSWYCIKEDRHPGVIFRDYIAELWYLIQMRPMYQVIAYKYFAGIFENFTITCADPIQSYWAEATPLNQKVMTIMGNVTIISVTIMDFMVTMLTTWDVIRNQWFWLGVPVAEALPNGIAFVIATFVMVELAGEGNEGAVYGLVGSISNIAIPLATTFTKNVGSSFDVTNADIVEDTNHQQSSRDGVCYLQHTMPIELWDEQLVPFLTLNEAVALAELSSYFYDVVHEHVQLRAEASLVCTVQELLRVLSKWRNLRNVAFQPVGDNLESGRLHESIHYNVNATGGLIVDLERNQPAPEPEPEPAQTNESYIDEDGELGLSGCSQIDGLHWLKGIDELDLSYCNFLEDVSFLGDSKHLNVCRGVSDVSPLSHVRHVSLRNCPEVTNVSALGTVYELNLGGCVNVTNVSALGNVHELNLSGCINVTDVSALGKVHTLKLRKCSGIVDVSALGGVKDLDLTGCINVTDLTTLDGLTCVRELDVSFCKNLTSLGTSLRQVHTIMTYRCEKLEDIQVLAKSAGYLTKVNLSGCSHISNISFVSGAREVDLRFCDALEDVRPLAQSARIVKLAGCSKLMDISPLAHVRELDLSYCPRVEDVSALKSVHTLSLRHCPSVHDVTALSSVHTLNLSGCVQLEDVSALRDVHELNLSDCCKVTDVSMLTGVRVLDLRYNKNNIDALKTGVSKLRGRVPIIRF
ncbi:hypothetical protein PHPALM_31216 [Phytophthora palmivora]|uniref:Folate-Biopterin Transporter (FBT) family n=1 Tax=Phytophthora palmivora TaxID=4796 RepID=A0A2P4X367_9STRA|nr:hypothetical protein PHPALM_31216 [Phytophthora palmivora]